MGKNGKKRKRKRKTKNGIKRKKGEKRGNWKMENKKGKIKSPNRPRK